MHNLHLLFRRFSRHIINFVLCVHKAQLFIRSCVYVRVCVCVTVYDCVFMDLQCFEIPAYFNVRTSKYLKVLLSTTGTLSTLFGTYV